MVLRSPSVETADVFRRKEPGTQGPVPGGRRRRCPLQSPPSKGVPDQRDRGRATVMDRCRESHRRPSRGLAVPRRCPARGSHRRGDRGRHPDARLRDPATEQAVRGACSMHGVKPEADAVSAGARGSHSDALQNGEDVLALLGQGAPPWPDAHRGSPRLTRRPAICWSDLRIRDRGTAYVREVAPLLGRSPRRSGPEGQ